MQMVGGTSDLKAPDETVMQVTASVRPAVEERLGKRFDIFQPVAYKSQVVAGRNFFVKVHVGNDEYIHLRIYQNIQQQIQLSNVQTGHNRESNIEYF
ncbi:cystatin-B-like isoform X2 [Artemia franciscana]